jgi:hypothetical protein
LTSRLCPSPPDEERYPTANVVKDFLMQGVQYIQLNSRAMREPCPATSSTELKLDGTNLARVAGYLRGEHNGRSRNVEKVNRTEALERWTDHLRFAIEDIDEIGWAKREPDNAEYIVLRYKNGFRCPNWLLSDGTLRMLALSLLAFLPPKPGIYMVEEPENGVHPRAIEIIIRSLSAIPGAQMLVATHSPLVVQQVEGKVLLIFARDENGTHIIPEPEEYEKLLDFDIGLTDLVKGTTGVDSKLKKSDFKTGHLKKKILKYRPKVLCFNGKTAAQVFMDTKKVNYGLQNMKVGKTLIFVAPSTSGAASGYWNEEYYFQLADIVKD